MQLKTDFRLNVQESSLIFGPDGNISQEEQHLYLKSTTHSTSWKSLGEIKANQPLWMGFRHDDDASPWGTYMSKLRANFEDSVRLILNANTVADLLTKEHEWLSHESLLSEDEKTALKRLDDLLSKDYGFFQLKIIKTNPDEQDEAITMTMVFDKLNALLKSQEQELLKLKEQILPSTSNNSEVDEDL